MNINGVEFDFNITSPTDVLRYKKAEDALKEKTEGMELPDFSSEEPNFLEKYCDFLNILLKLYGDYIDDIFGDGSAYKLMGNNPSLDKIAETEEAMGKAFEQQGVKIAKTMAKYTPNRATKRKKR